jgi:hypothetical protein
MSRRNGAKGKGQNTYMVALSRDARMLRCYEVAKRSHGDEQQHREKDVGDTAWDSSRWPG